MHRALITMLAIGLMSSTAIAEERGTEARAWLDLQRGGSQASETPRPMSGQQAQNIHERYLESFTHPIPEFYRDPDQAIVGSE